jgi:hypothetical protein
LHNVHATRLVDSACLLLALVLQLLLLLRDEGMELFQELQFALC